ncbi:Flavin-containing monooxygenase, partial [Scytalidium lignicola]
MAPSIALKATQTFVAPSLPMQGKDKSDDLNFDPEALNAKYAAERDKRFYRSGINQYRPIEGSLARYIKDSYTPSFSRGPIYLDCDVVIIGGGYGGQLVSARLIEQGINNFRIIEKGGGFGVPGTGIVIQHNCGVCGLKALQHW